MSLEGVVLASSVRWTLDNLLCQFKALCDKVSVFIDTDSPEAEQVSCLVKKHNVDSVTHLSVGGFLENVIQEIYNSVECEWFIRLDDDELLSQPLAHSLQSSSRILLSDTDVSCWKIARAFITNLNPLCYINGQEIINFPDGRKEVINWFPDFQWRLAKRGHFLHKGYLHEWPMTKGLVGVCSFPILHYSPLKPKEERKRIYQKYLTIDASRQREFDSLPDWEDRSSIKHEPCPYYEWRPLSENK